jgi:branched-chain amino acid transport system ATP-binding protein
MSSDAILETHGLTKAYGGLLAVDGVDLTVGRTEVRSVIGPNGAGKSTLFNLVNGFLEPTKGAVEFDGRDVTGLPAYERCQLGMGRSFQVNDFFGSLTVRENVRVGVQATSGKRTNPLTPAADLDPVNERTAEILERVELARFAGEQASSLSYGDQRKLELALALSSDPELLLLDEPTAGIGPDETREIAELIQRIATDKAVLLTEHDIDMVMATSDRITVIHLGEVIAEGTPEEIAANEDVQQAYIGGMDDE